MKGFSKRDKIKILIAHKMKDIITLLDNNGNLVVYTGGNIHGLNHYLEMIESPTTLNTLGQSSYNFCPSSSTNYDT